MVITLAVSLKLTARAWIPTHHSSYCEMNVWVEFWFGFDPLPTAA